MWVTSYILILFTTYGGNIEIMPDEHSPFESITDCNLHAFQAMDIIEAQSQQRALYSYICVPYETEVI